MHGLGLDGCCEPSPYQFDSKTQFSLVTEYGDGGLEFLL